MNSLNAHKTFLIPIVGLFTTLPFFAVIDGFGKDQQIAQSMAETAKKLISSLDPKKTTELVNEFKNSSRENWHFFPKLVRAKGNSSQSVFGRAKRIC